MSHETPDPGISELIVQARTRYRRPFGHSETPSPEVLAAYLAPDITWEEVAAKHHESIIRIQGIINDHLMSSDNYDWLIGRVGGGRALMEEYRPHILAAGNYHETQALYAWVPHHTQPFYDLEGSAPLFTQPVKLDLAKAEEGIDMIGQDLIRTVGAGLMSRQTFAFYYHCFDSTAKTVLGQLRESGIVVPNWTRFSINPDLLQQS